MNIGDAKKIKSFVDSHDCDTENPVTCTWELSNSYAVLFINGQPFHKARPALQAAKDALEY